MGARRYCYEKPGEALTAIVPELRQQYKELIKWYDGEFPGAHVIYGDVLNPFIDTLLDEIGTSDERPETKEILRRIFAHLETLSEDPDKQVQEVVAVTVCEYIGGHKERLFKAKGFMGPKTRKISEEVEDYWRSRQLP